ncbi:MAG: ArsR family transcriptional regulator [Promethearchaeota archaeon]
MNNNLFGLFKSIKRVQILNFLIQKEENTNFNEIYKQLRIAPSTLQYHLKQLWSIRD